MASEVLHKVGCCTIARPIHERRASFPERSVVSQLLRGSARLSDAMANGARTDFMFVERLRAAARCGGYESILSNAASGGCEEDASGVRTLAADVRNNEALFHLTVFVQRRAIRFRAALFWERIATFAIRCARCGLVLAACAGLTYAPECCVRSRARARPAPKARRVPSYRNAPMTAALDNHSERRAGRTMCF